MVETFGSLSELSVFTEQAGNHLTTLEGRKTMIQIQRPEQFRNAGERLKTEPQSVSRYEPGLYLVRNKKKGTGYSVRIERRDGHTFGTCSCPAGTPTHGRRIPQICKHLCAVVMLLRAVRAMKQHALAH
jgi:hypothetical protein